MPANPFTPNRPIDPQYFAGRKEELEKIRAALNQTKHGKTQHLLLTGHRGIGKSSLAYFTRYLAQEPDDAAGTDFRFATAYYLVEQNQTLSDVCRGLAAKLLAGIDRGLAHSCIERFKNLNLSFKVTVPGFAEVGVNREADKQGSGSLSADFSRVIANCWTEISSSHNGILLIIDELQNLDTFAGLGSFFKVVSEMWLVDGYSNLMFLPVGLPPVSAKLANDDSSAARIFSYVELNRMKTDESVSIVQACLSSTDKTIDEDAATLLADRSGGVPFVLHQLGYDAFEADGDGRIDVEDVNAGLRPTLVQFERMKFGSLYASIEGKKKQQVVDFMANRDNRPATPSEIIDELKIKNVHQYLNALERDSIVEKLAGGHFRLESDLFAMYVKLFKIPPAT